MVVRTKIKDPELIEKRQRQICQGAMKAFRAKGFHTASIRDIAKAGRISLGSLYDYIERKEDILFLVHKEILDQIYRHLDKCLKDREDPVDQLVGVLKELFRLTRQLKDEMLFVYTETKSLDKRYLHEILRREAEFVGAFESVIERGVREGVFDCRNPDLFSNIVVLLGSIIPLRGWNILPRHNEEEVVEELITLVLKGLDVKRPLAGA